MRQDKLPSTKKSTKDVTEHYEWPPLYEPRDLESIVFRISQIADSEIEHRLFITIFNRALQNIRGLEILYRELPAVLLDNPASVKHFQSILGISRSKVDDSPNNIVKKEKGTEQNSSGPHHYLIKPDRIFLLSIGIERISNGNRELYESYVTTLSKLWNNVGYLELLYRLALDDTEFSNDRFRDLLESVSNNAIYGANSNSSKLVDRQEINSLLRAVDEKSVGIEQNQFEWPPHIDINTYPPIFHDEAQLSRHIVIDNIKNLKLTLGATPKAGIRSVSPNPACSHQDVSIDGWGFGNSPDGSSPDGVEIFVGYTQVEIVSWSDNHVVIRIPAEANSGYIKFHYTQEEDTGFKVYEKNLESMAQVIDGLNYLGEPVSEAWPKPPYFPPADLISYEFLRIGTPVMESFEVLPGTVVEPDTQLTLRWQVKNYTSIKIKKLAGYPGPNVNLVNPVSNYISIGKFSGNSPITARYELEAENDCGTDYLPLVVSLSTKPKLKILGIEVVQVIQRENNSVRLVAGKQTAFRVYIDSGITNLFNWGSGENAYPDIGGTLKVFPAGGMSGVDMGPPRSLHIAQRLVSLGSANRDDRNASLNFRSPMNLVSVLNGPVRIEVTVFGKGHEMDVGGNWVDSFQTTVFFTPRPKQELLPLLISDTKFGLPAPSMASYGSSLSGAIARFPVAEDGFTINPPISLATSPTLDLTNDNGWNDLAFALATIIFLFPSTAVGGIRTGLVPDGFGYYWGGMAWYPNWPTIPSFACAAGHQATFAHEMGHAFGIRHANCPPAGTSGAPRGLDSRIPAKTEDTGLRVADWVMFVSGTAELMSYCGFEDRWPSIAFWNIVFDAPII